MTAGYDSHYRRYDRIYQAFLMGGVPLAGLLEGTKQIFHNTASESLLLDLYYLEAAMDAGANVGAITHQKELPGINPQGFWDLDIDGPDHGLDLSLFTYRVRRQGETDRAHYWARLPDPTVPLEASYKGKDYDLCTWNTVMPGSTHENGTVYELEHLEDGVWVPWDGEAFTLDLLPMVDPEQYRAQENQRVSRRSAKVQTLRRKPKKAQKEVVWVAATGSEKTRIKMARNYLCNHARESVSGRNGHDTLFVAMTNLRLFHRLEKALVLKMIQEHFNPRCVDLQGNPCPWSEAEIVHKWEQAGKPGTYPTLGVNNAKARAKEARIMLEGEVCIPLEVKPFSVGEAALRGRVRQIDLYMRYNRSQVGLKTNGRQLLVFALPDRADRNAPLELVGEFDLEDLHPEQIDDLFQLHRQCFVEGFWVQKASRPSGAKLLPITEHGRVETAVMRAIRMKRPSMTKSEILRTAIVAGALKIKQIAPEIEAHFNRVARGEVLLRVEGCKIHHHPQVQAALEELPRGKGTDTDLPRQSGNGIHRSWMDSEVCPGGCTPAFALDRTQAFSAAGESGYSS